MYSFSSNSNHDHLWENQDTRQQIVYNTDLELGGITDLQIYCKIYT